jgi:hypothetical protein
VYLVDEREENEALPNREKAVEAHLSRSLQVTNHPCQIERLGRMHDRASMGFDGYKTPLYTI